MRRVLGYANRYLMTKNGVLGVGCIGLSLVFALLISSCAPVSHDYIGTWNCQLDKLTYVNFDQHIKVTFPNDEWEVHTKPPHGALKMGWKRPTKTHPYFHVIKARIPSVGMLTQIMIEPVPKEMSLKEYLDRITEQFKVTEYELISSKVVERKNRTIGLILTKEGVKAITAVFKERGRFTLLTFSCPEALFESNKDQFWAIVDSYEYID